MLEFAKTVLRTEAQAIEGLIDKLDENFITAVDIIFNCRGRVVITGIGKSGIIAKKIVATFSSTGTPSLFLHPAEAIHGDLGMIVKGDCVIALSYSGETMEILNILPTIHRLKVPLISIVGNPYSKLAGESDVVLDVTIDHEACPLGLAPSASTTATLAMGDALAFVLLKKKGFSEEDFARIHPGGKLGKKLMRVNELMKKDDELPVVHESTLMKDTIYEISSKGLGVTIVENDEHQLTGILTDGDLRRAIEKDVQMITKTARQFMTKNPKTVQSHEFVLKAVSIMEQYSITALAVVDASQKPVGILKLQDIIKEGVI